MNLISVSKAFSTYKYVSVLYIEECYVLVTLFRHEKEEEKTYTRPLVAPHIRGAAVVTGKKGRKRQTIVVPELAPPQIPSPDPDTRPKTAPETDHSGSPTREQVRKHQPQFMSTSDLDNCGRPQNVECSESLEKGLLINLVLCCTQTIRERAQKFRGVLF